MTVPTQTVLEQLMVLQQTLTATVRMPQMLVKTQVLPPPRPASSLLSSEGAERLCRARTSTSSSLSNMYMSPPFAMVSHERRGAGARERGCLPARHVQLFIDAGKKRLDLVVEAGHRRGADDGMPFSREREEREVTAVPVAAGPQALAQGLGRGERNRPVLAAVGDEQPGTEKVAAPEEIQVAVSSTRVPE